MAIIDVTVSLILSIGLAQSATAVALGTKTPAHAAGANAVTVARAAGANAVTVARAAGANAVTVAPSGKLAQPRVSQALTTWSKPNQALVTSKGLKFPPRALFLRVFKKEKVIEIWGGDKADRPLKKLKEIPVCATGERLGPKREPGTGHTPEGFYQVSNLVAEHRAHLALRLDFPNDSDRVLGKSAIANTEVAIHGGCNADEGGIAVTDPVIAELYALVWEMRTVTPAPIAVHIFPMRLDDRGMQRLVADFGPESTAIDFWRNLKDGYEYFERGNLVPSVLIGKTGKYRFIP